MSVWVFGSNGLHSYFCTSLNSAIASIGHKEALLINTQILDYRSHQVEQGMIKFIMLL